MQNSSNIEHACKGKNTTSSVILGEAIQDMVDRGKGQGVWRKGQRAWRKGQSAWGRGQRVKGRGLGAKRWAHVA